MLQYQEPTFLNFETFADGIPHQRMRELREQHRLLWEPDAHATGGHWLVIQQKDIDYVLGHPELFSSTGGPLLEDMPAALLDPTRKSINLTDPPAHRDYRALVDYAFRPAMLKEREPIMREMARDIIDRVIDKGSCEFVGEVAIHLPMRVMFMLLGVRPEDEQHVVALTNAMLFADDPRYTSGRASGFDAKAELDEFGVTLAVDHRANPRDTITMEVLNTEKDGRRLTDREFGAFFTNLIAGGLDTTRNALTWGMVEFARNPDQYRRMQEDPALVPNAVEEILRYHNPVIYMRRTALQDVEFAGEQIARGAKMICLLGSPNRDPALFERPDEFDIHRPPVKTRRNYRTFGGGAHFCLGIHQARMNLAVMLREISSRFDNLRVLSEPRQIRSVFMNGLSELHLGFDKRGS